MISWRASWWYVQAFWQKYKKIVLVSCALGIGLVWVFPRIVVFLPQRKQVEYIGQVGLFSWSELPLEIQEKMSAGLTSLNVDGEPIPTLAERWSVEEDGKVFRFLIRENLRWQDGKSFGPDDVQYNFSDVQTVRTDNEVVFRLNNAYSPFPVAVSQPLFRQVQERQFGFLTRTKIIGLGEFSVSSVKYSGPYVQELVIENAQQRLVYRFYNTEQDALVAFRKGRVDKVEGLTSIDELSEKERQFFQVEDSVNPQQYVAIYLNTAHPDLSREIRQALNYATKKPEANDSKLRALGPVSPLSWAYNATNEINPFSYDLEQAIELYVKSQPAQPIKIRLDAGVTLLNEAQQVADNWHEFGEEVKRRCEAGQLKDEKGVQLGRCEAFGFEVTVQVVRDLQDFQAVMVAREIPPDPDQYTWWHSNQGQNITGYQNPRVDKLLEDARTETDQQKRKILYFEFQKYLVEDSPTIFLYYVPEYTLKRRNWL